MSATNLASHLLKDGEIIKWSYSMERYQNRFKLALITSIVGTLFGIASINTKAASSQLFFDNASGLGNAYSGEAAIADDASTLYFNPAGLTRIHQQQLIFGGVEARFNGNFKGSDIFFLPTVGFIPQSGYVTGIPTLAPYPFMYYSRPINDKLTLGVGMMTPFGVGIGIPQKSIVRYSGTRAVIFVIDISPAIAYKINEKLSAGLGLDIQRMQYTTAVMFPNLSPAGGPDEKIHNDAVGWGLGWHGGLLYEFNACTRAGLAFHSQTVLHPNGQSQFIFTPGNNVSAEIVSNNFKFSTTLPPTTTLSVYHDATPSLALLGTVDYSKWSDLQQMVLKNVAIPSSLGTPSQIDVVIKQHYRDTWRLALGTNYKFNQKWMGRLGYAYENDPTNSNVRPLTDPGTGSNSVAIGAHYQAIKTVGIDLGYSHYFIFPSSIHTTTGSTIENGTVNLQRDALGFQVTWDLV